MAGKKALVIDDEQGMRWALQKALGEEGFEVLTAENGTEGLELLTSTEITITMLDYKMPGMSGLEVLEHIRAAHPGVAVIFMTGYSSMDIALEALQRGAVGYITKPFKLKDLKMAVRKALGEEVVEQ